MPQHLKEMAKISSLKAPGLEALPWLVISAEKSQQKAERQEGTASKNQKRRFNTISWPLHH